MTARFKYQEIPGETQEDREKRLRREAYQRNKEARLKWQAEYHQRNREVILQRKAAYQATEQGKATQARAIARKYDKHKALVSAVDALFRSTAEQNRDTLADILRKQAEADWRMAQVIQRYDMDHRWFSI